MTLEEMGAKIEETNALVHRLVSLQERGAGQERFSMCATARMLKISVSTVVRLKDDNAIDYWRHGRTCHVVPAQVVRALEAEQHKRRGAPCSVQS